MNGMAGIEAFWGICIDAGQWKTMAEDPGIFTGAGTRGCVAAQPGRLTMRNEEPGERHREYTRFLYFVTMFMMLGKRREESNETIP